MCKPTIDTTSLFIEINLGAAVLIVGESYAE